MKSKKLNGKKVEKIINDFHQNKYNIPSDVQGSYTGLAENYDEPVQDADDL